MFNAFKFDEDVLSFDRITKNSHEITFTFEGKKYIAKLLKREGRRLHIQLFGDSNEPLSEAKTLDVIHIGKQHQYRMAQVDKEYSFKALHNAQEALEEEASYTAPMTAKVVKVFAKAGETVQEGQSLISLEAMKLQIDIKATSEQIIDQVLVKEGNQVQQGDVLLSMKEE